jgi:hypothetical protein
MAVSRYYGFETPLGYSILIGSSYEQVCDSIIYHGLKGSRWQLPTRNDLVELDRIAITCALPGESLEENIEARILENVTLFINPESIERIKGQLNDLNGSNPRVLSHFAPGNKEYSSWFVPRDMLEAARDFLKKKPKDKPKRRYNQYICDLESMKAYFDSLK